MKVENLRQIIQSINTQAFLYCKTDNTVLSLDTNDDTKSPAPIWITTMIDGKLSRKAFQKDDSSYCYYCFSLSEDSYILIQDNISSHKLNLFFKAIFEFNSTQQATSDKSKKEEIIKYKTEVVRLTRENKQKDNIIEDLKNKSINQNTQESEKLKKIIRELTDTNNSYASQIARMKADTEYMNFQKLKKVNTDLRNEVVAIQYKAANSENELNKVRKTLQNTIAELSRFAEMSRIEHTDLRDLASRIASGELKDTPSITGASKLIASIQEKETSLTGAKLTASLDNNPSLTGAKLTVSLDNNPSLTGAKLTASLDNSPSLTGAKLTASLDNNPSLTGERYIGEKTRQRDISDIVNALNSYIAKNDSTGINIDKLTSVLSIRDKEGIKRSPATALKPLVGTLIGMSKASRLSSHQINIICDALGVR